MAEDIKIIDPNKRALQIIATYGELLQTYGKLLQDFFCGPIILKGKEEHKWLK